MSKRIVCLRKAGNQGPQPGDRVKVVGGNVCIGMVGLYQEDGNIDFGNENVRRIELRRTIVVELGPVPLGEKYIRPSFETSPPTKTKLQKAFEKLRPKEPWKEVKVKEPEKPAPQPTKMEKRGQARRKKGADWDFS